MRRHIAIIAAIALMATKSALYAADFSALAPTGQTLYFNLDNRGGAVVTYPGNTANVAWAAHPDPIGVLVLPDSVDWQGQRLPVHALTKSAFRGCDRLTSITIPRGITSIDTQAFYNCTALATVTLGASVDTIRASAFLLCNALNSVTVKSPTPPYLEPSAFSSSTRAQATLHVGCGLTDLYSQASPWNTFGTIDEVGCTILFDIAANHTWRGTVSGDGEYTYGTSVQLTATPADGYFFACWSDGDTLSPRTLAATAHLNLRANFFPFLHDTLHLHDTLLLEVRDTLALHDTVPTTTVTHRLTVVTSDAAQGIAAGNITAPEGTLVEVAAIPLEGYRFSHWSDGDQHNPRQVALTHSISLVANFTTALGITPTLPNAMRVSVEGLTMDIRCHAGAVISIYSVDGRLLHRATGSARFATPSPGTYLVQQQGYAAKRVIIP